jgi:nicotinamidase-related amidase
VDFQKDFASPTGKCYRPRGCIDFINIDLQPYYRQHGLQIAEIVSDYRLPRPGDEFECCVPGTSGYESGIQAGIKKGPAWIKSMNSPVWTRKNAGNPARKPGLPAPNPRAFSAWLRQVIGLPEEVSAVVLIGLTIDCCVLCIAQELSFRAYPVRYLIEGVDTFSGDQAEKEAILKSPAANWGQAITWSEFKKLL